MNVLILGCNTVNGRVIMQRFIEHDHIVHGTMHDDIGEFKYISKAENANYYGFVNALEQPDVFDDIANIIEYADPDIVINCIDSINPYYIDKPIDIDKYANLKINSIFPHTISKMCDINGSKFIQISNSLVFSGNGTRDYTEFDTPDASTLYGKTKHLGEITDQPHVLTLRCTTFGRELMTHYGPFERVAMNSGNKVTGNVNVLYNPLSATEFAKVVVKLTEDHPDASGLYNVSMDDTSEFHLMYMINQTFEFGADVVAKISPAMKNYTLDSTLFQNDFPDIPIQSLIFMIWEFCQRY